MKLYATTTSERATKGQGGNKEIFIDLRVGDTDNSRSVAWIKLKCIGDSYFLVWNDVEKGLDTQMLKEGQIKGEKL